MKKARSKQVLRLETVLEWRAEHWGDRSALVTPDNGQEVTFGELWELVTGMTNELSARGVRQGDRVLGRFGNGLLPVVAMAACHRLGATWVPLNTRLSEKEMANIASDAQPRIVLADELQGPLEDSRGYPQYVLNGDFSFLEETNAAPDSDSGVASRGTSPAYILYTSGTTGRPKGVVLSHRAVLENTRRVGSELGAREGEILVQPLPLYHVGGLSLLWVFLYAGGTVILPRKYDSRLSLSVAYEYSNVSILETPTTMGRLFDLLEQDGVPEDLRRVIYSGSPPTSRMLERGVETLGNRLVQLYGITETAPTLTLLRGEEHAQERLRSAGRPLREIFIEIKDEQDNSLPRGRVGEIAVDSPAVMDGYWQKAAETEAALRDGWFYTGDLGYVDEDGYVFVVGRKKEMIISGAENIYPREVEDVLSQHPDVREVAVLGVPNEEWGEVVAAVVVVEKGGPVSERELEAFCLDHLARYKRPRQWLFLNELPRLETGKIDKKALQGTLVKTC